MEENMKTKILRVVTNRLLVITLVFFGMFYFLVTQLFDLQIVNGHVYEEELTITRTETIEIPAPRGTIYDRLGRPLAINKSAYVIKLNPGIKVENINDIVLNMANFLEVSGEKYDTYFPISRTQPYTFAFNNSEAREKRWKKDINVAENLTADEAMESLRKKFDVDEKLSDDDAWKIVAFRSLIYINRFNMHLPITIAFDVKEETVIQLEENNELYESFYYDIEPLREYPGGESVSHIIGYTGRINDKEYEAFKDKGYGVDDKIGKTGLEKSFEDSFRGTAGWQEVEMAQNGRPIRVNETKLPTPGDKLFLTIDLEYQKKIYTVLEEQLKEILKNKLKGVSAKEKPISQKELFISMVKSNNIPVKDILDAESGENTLKIKAIIEKSLKNMEKELSDEKEENPQKIREKNAKLAFCDAIDAGEISSKTMVLIMYELGILNDEESYLESVKAGRRTTLQVIIDKIDDGQITPQMTNLDPCTGSVVVVETATGGVLAAVNYPSFDNNRLANYMDNAYYNKINNDPTTPLLNRSFMERRAPGSTFKMISALAGLESGIIKPTTRITDLVAFTKAGRPYAKCWSSVSHGSINVEQALEHSCNYFFSDMAYEMGNSKNGNQLDSISILNKYMIEFGLNDRSGVEIGEYRDAVDFPLAISSPAFKEKIETDRNSNAPRRDVEWVDGDTVRTSFGQAYNGYSAAVMAKYINMLATNGVYKDLHLMDKVYVNDVTEDINAEDAKVVRVENYKQKNEHILDLDPEHLKVVINGMLKVTSTGTARSTFEGFPIKVAGKTGTAQESTKRQDHASFGGFAPVEDPQIAVYVIIPYGNTTTTAKPAAQVAKEAIAEYFGLNNTFENDSENKDLSM